MKKLMNLKIVQTNTQEEKIIKRSPHVFGDKVANSPEEALAIWNAIKYREYKKRV